MSSLKIAVKITQLADIKVKLKIEIENHPKSMSYIPQEITQANINEPGEVDSSKTNHFHAEMPEVTLPSPSGSFWQNLLSRLKFWRRN